MTRFVDIRRHCITYLSGALSFYEPRGETNHEISYRLDRNDSKNRPLPRTHDRKCDNGKDSFNFGMRSGGLEFFV